MKLLYIDTETTGLDIKTCSICQLSGYLVDTSSKKDQSFNFNIRPYKSGVIHESALKVNHLTREELESFPDQAIAFNSFKRLLLSYIDMNDPEDRVIPIGYNVSFDLDFVRDWFNFNKSVRTFSNSIFYPGVDVMYLASYYLLGKRKSMKNFKLTTVYETIMGKPFDNAHNAMADIQATRELLDVITGDLHT